MRRRCASSTLARCRTWQGQRRGSWRRCSRRQMQRRQLTRPTPPWCGGSTQQDAGLPWLRSKHAARDEILPASAAQLHVCPWLLSSDCLLGLQAGLLQLCLQPAPACCCVLTVVTAGNRNAAAPGASRGNLMTSALATSRGGQTCFDSSSTGGDATFVNYTRSRHQQLLQPLCRSAMMLRWQRCGTAWPGSCRSWSLAAAAGPSRGAPFFRTYPLWRASWAGGRPAHHLPGIDVLPWVQGLSGAKLPIGQARSEWAALQAEQ